MSAIAWIPGLVVLSACLLAACEAGLAGHARHEPAVRIELLGFPDCPNTPALRQNLAAAAAAEGLTFTEVDLLALPRSDPRRAWPAPTVLVNGADLLGMPRPDGASPGCRVYPGGVPTVAAIRARLAAHRPRS